jgi:hypothetical protein
MAGRLLHGDAELSLCRTGDPNATKETIATEVCTLAKAVCPKNQGQLTRIVFSREHLLQLSEVNIRFLLLRLRQILESEAGEAAPVLPDFLWLRAVSFLSPADFGRWATACVSREVQCHEAYWNEVAATMGADAFRFSTTCAKEMSKDLSSSVFSPHWEGKIPLTLRPQACVALEFAVALCTDPGLSSALVVRWGVHVERIHPHDFVHPSCWHECLRLALLFAEGAVSVLYQARGKEWVCEDEFGVDRPCTIEVELDHLDGNGMDAASPSVSRTLVRRQAERVAKRCACTSGHDHSCMGLIQLVNIAPVADASDFPECLSNSYFHRGRLGKK